MEPIEVSVHFDLQGEMTPLNFTWSGTLYPIDSTGRRWDNAEGRHILVMIPIERVIELLFIPTTGRWYLKRLETGPKVA